ncbi:MAG: LuxR C-terminal-related transcriptional regulator [Endomicrobia bacterium]|nr:LuxR C-terminal-related transcriptional regulator [Endomicrobiia bacterium]
MITKVKTYFASSAEELRADRLEIGDFFRRLNDCFLDSGLYFSLMTRDGDNAINVSEILDCDLAFFLFFAKTDPRLLEAYIAANENRIRVGNPSIAVYFKVTDTQTLAEAMKHINTRFCAGGECYCHTYSHVDTLKLGVLMQIYEAASRRNETVWEIEHLDARLYQTMQIIIPDQKNPAPEQWDESSGMPELAGSARDIFLPEEREIALLLTEGDTQRDIARKLKLTAAEVSRHVKAIREKIIGAGDPEPTIAIIADEFKLTRREARILRCLNKGMSNAEMAAELFISEETVRFHIHNLFKKLPVDNRQGIAEWILTKSN